MQLSEEEMAQFFEEVKERIDSIKAIVKNYGVEDEFAMSYIGGLYVGEDDESTQFAAQVDYVVSGEDELDELLSASLELYRMHIGMTADEKASVPEDLHETENWTAEDWMRFISKNTNGESH